MYWNWLKFGLGSGVIVVAAGMGCNSTGSSRATVRPAVVLTERLPDKPAATQATSPSVAATETHVNPEAPFALTSQPKPDTQIEETATKGEEVQGTKHESKDAIVQAGLDGGGEALPKRRSFVDTTAHPSFAHAPDYSWLSGEVQYSRLSRGWRLRYASVDEVDAYGGSVTLADDPRLSELKDGEHFRIQGRIVDSEHKNIAPEYKVESILTLGKSE